MNHFSVRREFAGHMPPASKKSEDHRYNNLFFAFPGKKFGSGYIGSRFGSPEFTATCWRLAICPGSDVHKQCLESVNS